ncbi:hypothetical protein JCM1841_004070 [Sporobolomyces salmonicolor]
MSHTLRPASALLANILKPQLQLPVLSTASAKSVIHRPRPVKRTAEQRELQDLRTRRRAASRGYNFNRQRANESEESQEEVNDKEVKECDGVPSGEQQFGFRPYDRDAIDGASFEKKGGQRSTFSTPDADLFSPAPVPKHFPRSIAPAAENLLPSLASSSHHQHARTCVGMFTASPHSYTSPNVSNHSLSALFEKLELDARLDEVGSQDGTAKVGEALDTPSATMRPSPRMCEISELAAPHPSTSPDAYKDSSSNFERDGYISASFNAAEHYIRIVACGGSPSLTPRSKTSCSPGGLPQPLTPRSSPPLNRRSSSPLPEPSSRSTTFRIHDESGYRTSYGASSFAMQPSSYSSESSALGFQPRSSTAQNTFASSSLARVAYSTLHPPLQPLTPLPPAPQGPGIPPLRRIEA